MHRMMHGFITHRHEMQNTWKHDAVMATTGRVLGEIRDLCVRHNMMAPTPSYKEEGSGQHNIQNL